MAAGSDCRRSVRAHSACRDSATSASMGCVNVHGSLLAEISRRRLRSSGPSSMARPETGITTMLMDEGMDTGAMLLQEELEISPDDTAGTLAPRLAELGGRLLVDTIAQLKAGTLTPKKQDDGQATLAPILKKEDGLIDWTMSATALANRVRGLSPWPGAYTFFGGGALEHMEGGLECGCGDR